MRFNLFRQSYRKAVLHFGNDYRKAYQCVPPRFSLSFDLSSCRMNPHTMVMFHPQTLSLQCLNKSILDCLVDNNSINAPALDLSPMEWLLKNLEDYQFGSSSIVIPCVKRF